ncbi:MAG: hypothetical protein WC208_08220 [Gallionella sp.]|jgi:hypothetical protein
MALTGVAIPIDKNARPVSVLYGFDSATGLFYPITVVDKGDGTFQLLTAIDDNPMNKKNITMVYTYVVAGYGLGKVATVKEYPTGATGGAPAKLTTFTYGSNNKVSSVAVSDTTV